ncbi:chemotaxis protein CheW [Fischerella thermalis CCMEE 5268]|uniref:Chemotaxis protein CheW n=1 Tax=Fischerella thermalis CCMEE 5268 TaxID=2019662 RepID=A0A2N6KMP9_9CYAN|nr:chemotaxis protein CheW [Fischerella thermalis]PMB01234.1 chemotaxis protein CheW [Fischerella thermalis CCMEE 5268]
MENKQFLTFRVCDLQYGIESVLVQEIFPLPELTPIAEAPANILGILNWRGKILPMIHLDFYEGHLGQDCRLSDFVIVVQWEDLQIGIVVQQVNELLELDTEFIETGVPAIFSSHINTALITGVAKLDSGMIALLNVEALIHQETLLTFIWNTQIQLDMMSESPTDKIYQAKPEVSNTSFYDLYCSGATPKERATFRQRAEIYKQPIDSLETTTPIPLTVIRFGDEYFGVNLELVREITCIRNLSPIPYSPKHIVGNMHLRGEIFTLVDIRNILHLPVTLVTTGSMAVVVQVDDIVAGVPVDEVLELIYINSADITPLPTTASTTNKLYLRGIAPFEGKMLSVLDLAKIFTKGELAVKKAS